jgi:hypothetical protein
MDAVNFSTECWFTPCSGSGPWVQADLEAGLFAGGNGSDLNNNGNSSAFVTALIKNDGQANYAVKGGNAQKGSLRTWYEGTLPSGYTMHQEGAIVLGTGGDDSDGSVGSFFEGAMTFGYPSDAADDAVQANIASVGYKNIYSNLRGTYQLINVNSGKVLEAANCGTDVDLWKSLGNSCQQWTLKHVGNSKYTIINVNSRKVLDVVDCGRNDRAAVDLSSYSQGNNCQQWDVIPTGGGYYEIIGENSGIVLDDVNCGTDNGAEVDLWEWLNNTCQEWYLNRGILQST